MLSVSFPSLARSRVSVGALFFVNGTVIASWVSHIPAVRVLHALSESARVRATPPAIALAAVTTTGYLGFLAGPPLIGLAAELTSLPVALGLVCAGCALLAVGAGRLPAR